MALSHSFFPIFLLLVLASATDYRYDSKPDPKPNPSWPYVPKPYYMPIPTSSYSPWTLTHPDRVKPTHESTPKYDEPKVVETDKTSYNPKPNVYYVEPSYKNVPKPELVKPYHIAIEGLVVCRSGSNYVPIQGAVVKITCKVVDQNGYETKKPVSCESGETNAMGYFYKKLDLSLGLEDVELRIGECEAVLATSSPMESCKYPTDVNRGISGALLSSFKILSDKHLKLYSVGPFFYTPNPAPQIMWHY